MFLDIIDLRLSDPDQFLQKCSFIKKSDCGVRHYTNRKEQLKQLNSYHRKTYFVA